VARLCTCSTFLMIISHRIPLGHSLPPNRSCRPARYSTTSRFTALPGRDNSLINAFLWTQSVTLMLFLCPRSLGFQLKPHRQIIRRATSYIKLSNNNHDVLKTTRVLWCSQICTHNIEGNLTRSGRTTQFVAARCFNQICQWFSVWRAR
jgi:hypothetical protein